jgi:hypothetical protein
VQQEVNTGATRDGEINPTEMKIQKRVLMHRAQETDGERAEEKGTRNSPENPRLARAAATRRTR